MKWGDRSIIVLVFAAALGVACGSSGGTGATSVDAGAAATTPPPQPTSPPGSNPWPDAGASGGDASVPPPEAAPPAFTCTGKAGGKGDSTLSLMSGGLARTSLLHVPTTYDPTRGAMLVINFHGFSSDATQQELLTNMVGAADANDFVVAHPQGIGNGWNAGTCCTQLQTTPVDDIQFTRDLLANISASYCIDPKRIYATGMSNGGFMSHRIACELSDVFAAVAPVAGVLGIPPGTCNPTRTVPILDFHGTADPVVPYDGGPTNPDPLTQAFTSVQQTMNFWRLKDVCIDAPETTYQHGDATCVKYAGCSGAGDVTLCTIDGGGHTWPGGLPIPAGKTSTDIDATKTIVSFFQSHPMP